MSNSASFRHVKVIGAGLIGTSIALGLKQAGYELTVEDEDISAEEIAQDLIGQKRGLDQSPGASEPELNEPDPELVVIATPILAVPHLVKEVAERYPVSRVIDIGGLKSDVVREVEKFPEVATRFCSTHPMAGREISGALAARGDLFEGRIWIYTPVTGTERRTIDCALEVIAALGAIPVLRGSVEHDRIIAGISHLPQIVSSLLSAALSEMSVEDLGLAGAGLRDVSRLAASNPDLWAELLHANRSSLNDFLVQFTNLLNDLSTSLQNDDLRKTHEILEMGRLNHRRIPGKHGGKKRDYWYLPIVIDDRPGQLALIFDACKDVEVNVEDLSIEHTPGQESGLVTLALSHDDAIKVFDHLMQDGWKVHQPRESIG